MKDENNFEKQLNSYTIVGFSVVLLVVVGCSLLRSKFLNGRLIKPLDSLPLLDSSRVGHSGKRFSHKFPPSFFLGSKDNQCDLSGGVLRT